MSLSSAFFFVDLVKTSNTFCRIQLYHKKNYFPVKITWWMFFRLSFHLYVLFLSLYFCSCGISFSSLMLLYVLHIKLNYHANNMASSSLRQILALVYINTLGVVMLVCPVILCRHRYSVRCYSHSYIALAHYYVCGRCMSQE